jgi:hypothetical protein
VPSPGTASSSNPKPKGDGIEGSTGVLAERGGVPENFFGVCSGS